ncbi:hypothetical protein CLV84_1857 [Neolewinella xylanilytica]|uniref:Sulfite dehydrogenase (Cytochrome) subunit SorB n=1 Tax=Neolewinella xylanilytica TaxID=1514080 RepID=A0A2S6IBK1_9BACT|nr:cytochrome C [Neolewinella xylanilytica]PPK88883.1 hypothetical protein CLV84_1857 [Neolewinella xylanilytica]
MGFRARAIGILGLLTMAALAVTRCTDEDTGPQPTEAKASRIVDGLDMDTGLIAEGEYLLVKGNCLACHSAKLVTQNRATREGWSQMIDWMQEKQGLWDLGPQREPILDYLATYYAPDESGRRPPLENIEWYKLDADE